MEHCWNDNGRVRLKHLEKNLSQYHFVYHKSNWTGLGSKLGLRGEMAVGQPPEIWRGRARHVEGRTFTETPNFYRVSAGCPNAVDAAVRTLYLLLSERCICWLSERCICWKASDCLMLVTDVHFRIEC
jgi:hypothetical protein